MPDRRQQLLTQLSAYLDDELSPPERAQVEALLADDADARRLLADLRATAEALRSLPRARAGDDLMDKLRARLEREALLGGVKPAAAVPRGGSFRSGKLIAAAAVIALSFAAAYMMWPQGRQAALKQFALHTPERKATSDNTTEKTTEEPGAPTVTYDGITHRDEGTRGFYADGLKSKETPSAAPAAQPAAPAAKPESAARELAAPEAAKSSSDTPLATVPDQPADKAEKYAYRGLAEKKAPLNTETLRVETDARRRTVERFETTPPAVPAEPPAPPAVAAVPPPVQIPAETKPESPPVVADAMARGEVSVIEGPPLPPALQGGFANTVHDDLKVAATAPEVSARTYFADAGSLFGTIALPSSQPSVELGSAQADGVTAPQMTVSTLENGDVTVVDLAYATLQDQQQALASIASQYPSQQLADATQLPIGGDIATQPTREAGAMEPSSALAMADKDGTVEGISTRPMKPAEDTSEPFVATAYEVLVPDESARKQIVADLAKSAGEVVSEPASNEPVVVAGAPFQPSRAAAAERGDAPPSPSPTAQPETADRSGGLNEPARAPSMGLARQSQVFDGSATSQATPMRRQIHPQVARAARPQMPQTHFGRQQIMPASQPMGQAGQNTLRLYLRVQPGQEARIQQIPKSRLQQLPARPTQSPPAGAPRP